MASRRSAASAPSAPRSPAFTGVPSRRRPTTRLPMRRCRSAWSAARQNTAMISEAAVMSKPPVRCIWRRIRVSMRRRARSFRSSARRQPMASRSRSSALPQYRWLSSIAASRLLAAVMAWMSPLKCRLMSASGAICAQPPPVAPPFMPKQGPRDGSRRQARALRPSWFKPSARPMLVVVLPSPAGVGEMAVTSTSLPGSLLSPDSAANGSLAL